MRPTLLALTLAVGIVIDDAVIVLEIIFRYMEEKKMSAREAAVEGTREIGLAVLATTLSLVIVFLPVSFLSSVTGRLLFEFGITASVAVMISTASGRLLHSIATASPALRPRARRARTSWFARAFSCANVRVPRSETTAVFSGVSSAQIDAVMPVPITAGSFCRIATRS